MIHDTHFNLAGINSFDKHVVNVSIGGGLTTDTLISGKRINEEKIDGRDKPYFYGVDRDPLSFSLNLWFEDGLDEKEIQDIMRWLDSDDYQPFYFINHPQRLWYVMVEGDLQLIHNGLINGYLSLIMRTNHTFTLSPSLLTETYVFENNSSGRQIDLEYGGSRNVKPIIYLKKIGDGNVTIRNLSNNTGDFTFRGLSNGELITIDCENQDIETDIPGIHRYDDFNDNFLELTYGINRLEVVGNVELQFEFENIGY